MWEMIKKRVIRITHTKTAHWSFILWQKHHTRKDRRSQSLSTRTEHEAAEGCLSPSCSLQATLVHGNFGSVLFTQPSIANHKAWIFMVIVCHLRLCLQQCLVFVCRDLPPYADVSASLPRWVARRSVSSARMWKHVQSIMHSSHNYCALSLTLIQT